MDEVNYKEDFPVEGPLWIQVQALEKGLEIIVTKAQISNEHALESLEEVEDLIDLTIPDKVKHEIDAPFDEEDLDDEELDTDVNVKLITSFSDFENVIALSHYFQPKYEEEIETILYYYDDKYYLFIEVKTDFYDVQEDIFSQILEYSVEEDITSHLLEEYGKVIIPKDVFSHIRTYF